MSRKATAQIEFSTVFPRNLVVITAYQEQHSATTISGTMIFEMLRTVSDFTMSPSWRNTIAHWMTKQISAMVATERPTAMLDSHVSNSAMRCTSARGSTERNAQPNT